MAKFFGPPKGGLPWSFVEVDADATFNRTEHHVDGFTNVNVWSHFRPGQTAPVHIQAQPMEWRIENTSATASKEFLSSTCIQHAFRRHHPV